MKKYHFRYTVLLIVILLFTSCTIYKTGHHQNVISDIPDKFSLYDKNFTESERWWETFDSSELNILVETALRDNLSLEESGARLEQALATAIKQGAARWPDVSLSGQSSYFKTKKTNGAGEQSSFSYEAGIAASYEVDLWGRVKALTKSARLDLQTSKEDLNTAAMTITSEIALTWFEIISISNKIKILENQLKTNETMSELTEMCYKRGTSTALDVFQQRQTLAAIKTKFPLLKADLKVLENTMALLLGRMSLKEIKISANDMPTMPPLPGTGIPADLLARRPDIKKAGLKLQSADWLVSAAKANRLPALRLTASYKYEAERPVNLFDNWITNLAASITGPIFQGGYLKAEVKRTEAVVKERLASYRQIVIFAIHEVENYLEKEKRYKEYLNALDEQLKAGRKTYKEAIEFYRKGAATYINVLDALNTIQSLEIAFIDAKLNYYKNRISLYRSLGGTWMTQEKEIIKRSGAVND